MHHTGVLRELIIIKDVSVTEMAKRLNKYSHAVISISLNARDISFVNLIEILGDMDYELVIRRKSEGYLPDGEYALHRTNYENWGEQ